MINDVDEALCRLLRDRALQDVEAELLLDAPVAGWRDQGTTPTVDVHLYDLREDVDRRPADWEDVRDEMGRRVGRRPPLRHYLLSYAVTAWAGRVEEEHRLLSRVLTCLAAVDHLPADCLGGSLAGSPEPVTVSVALPPPGRDIARAVQGDGTAFLRPVLHVLVGTTLRPGVDEMAAGPVRERRISVAAPGAAPEAVPSGPADLALVRARTAR